MKARDAARRGTAERLAASQYGVITRADARVCGLTPRMLERKIEPGGPWQRLLPGVYLTHTGEPSQDQQLMAALCYCGDDAIITGLAALQRYGIRGPAASAVDVLVPHVVRRASSGFVVVHRTRQVPRLRAADGPIRYVGPARAVADAAPGLRQIGDVRAITAGAVQRGLCTVAELGAELAQRRRREAGLLRVVLGEVADGIRSPAEADFRDLVRRSGLPAPLYNARLYLGRQLLAVPDVWWPQAGVAAEVDSRAWHLAPDGWEQTMKRHRRMTAAGILVLHVSPGQVRAAPGEVIADLAAALRSGHPRPAITTRPAAGSGLRAAS